MKYLRIFLLAMLAGSGAACNAHNSMQSFSYVQRMTPMDRDAIARYLEQTTHDAAYAEGAHYALLRGLYDNDLPLVDIALAHGASAQNPLQFGKDSPVAYGQLSQTLLTRAGAMSDVGQYVTLDPLLRAIGPKQHDTGGFIAYELVAGAQARQLLQRHHGMDMTRDNLYYAFAIAIYKQDVPAMEYWRSQGLDMSWVYPSGLTPVHIAAAMGKPQSVQWLAKNGANVNQPMRTIMRDDDHYVFTNATPLHLLMVDGLLSAGQRKQTLDALVAAGANPNAQATLAVYRHKRLDETHAGMTPLHIHFYRAGTVGAQGAEQRSYHLMTEALTQHGADHQRRNASGQTPEEVRLAALAKRQKVIASTQAANRSGASSFNPGAVFGVAAMAGLGAYGAAQGGEMGMRAMEVSGAGLADIASKGRTNHTQQALERAGSASTTAGAGADSAKAAGLNTEDYRFTCTSGTEGNVPLAYRTAACRSAQIDFARTYGCNDYKRFEAVHQACASACGDKNCLQR